MYAHRAAPDHFNFPRPSSLLGKYQHVLNAHMNIHDPAMPLHCDARREVLSRLTPVPVRLPFPAAPPYLPPSHPSDRASAVSPVPVGGALGALIHDFQRRRACLRFVKDPQALAAAVLHLAAERGASPPLASRLSRVTSTSCAPPSFLLSLTCGSITCSRDKSDFASVSFSGIAAHPTELEQGLSGRPLPGA